MRVSIDWLSITLPIRSLFQLDNNGEDMIIPEAYHDDFPEICDYILSFPDRKQGKGNRIFNRSMHSPMGGYTVFWNPSQPFSLIEITSKGMQNLREIRLSGKMAVHYSEFLTRIDFAVDFETDIRPKTFAETRDQKRFTSYGDIKSETGETYYVGSRSSDRFVRVYRYNPPHPRSHLLRAEFQLKKDNAKVAAASLRNHSVREICESLLYTFGFSHEIIQSSYSNKKMLAAPRDYGNGSTVRWLFKQVLPAITKLVSDGDHENVDLFLKMCYDKLSHARIHEEVWNGASALQDWSTDNQNFTAEHLPSDQQVP